jgi:hypothetical protein
MIRSDEQWLSIIDTFHSAAIGAQSWETALRGFADVTGSRSAQLAGFDSNTALTFNIMTNVAPELSKAVAGTVSINPRVKPVSEAPVLKVIAEADFMAPEEWRRNPFYQEIAVPWDCPFIAMTTPLRLRSFGAPNRILQFCAPWSFGGEITTRHRSCSMYFHCRPRLTGSPLRHEGWLWPAVHEARRRRGRRFCRPRTR